MINKTVKLEESDVDLLRRRAEAEGCSASEVIRRALRAYCPGDACGAAWEHGGMSSVVSAQQAEIRELHRLLDQSQQLQLRLMAPGRALPEGGQKKKKKRKKKRKGRRG